MKNYKNFYEEQTSVKVKNGYDIHHIDFNRKNNDINNLLALPRELHIKYHNQLNSFKNNLELCVLDTTIEQGYNLITAEKLINLTKTIKEIEQYYREREQLRYEAENE